MNLSLLIKNARIVDGTGGAELQGHIGIAGDRIVGMGKIDAPAEKTIDASGLVASPGFIELHTHYDPQLCWDRTASPAAEHGVTSVVTGNCSLSLAPVRAGESGKLTRMFNRIEDLRPEFFQAAVPYSWQTFAEYLRFLEPGLGVNVGAAIGHSTLRHYALGVDAQRRPSSQAELDAMCGMVAEAVGAGAFGISLAFDHIHDDTGEPVASSCADTRERIALARALVQAGKRFVQCNIHPLDTSLRLHQLEELAIVSLESGASVSALGILDNPVQPGQWQPELEKLEELRSRGARVYAETQVRPLDLAFQLSKAWIVAFYMPSWADIMLRPAPERIALFGERSRRAALERETVPFERLMHEIVVRATHAPENERYLGRKVIDIAAERGTTFTDALLDLALADELETRFDWRDVIHADPNVVSKLLLHPLLKVGGSDAGAHITQFAGEGDTTLMLQRFVRELGLVPLPRAVQRMTSEIADDFAIRERGTLREGYFADIVLFDPTTVRRGPEELLDDVPGGGGRYVRRASGIEQVIVNGQVFVVRGAYTDARAGRLI